MQRIKGYNLVPCRSPSSPRTLWQMKFLRSSFLLLTHNARSPYRSKLRNLPHFGSVRGNPRPPQKLEFKWIFSPLIQRHLSLAWSARLKQPGEKKTVLILWEEEEEEEEEGEEEEEEEEEGEVASELWWGEDAIYT